MSTINASTVKELREKTGAGMMDCKKALEETSGDFTKAIDWLRQKGLSKAAKKAGRTTSEGLIGCEVLTDATSAVLVEVKCETDFVSRGETFQTFVKDIAQHIMKQGFTNEETLLSQPYLENKNRTVQDVLNETIATIGENIVIGRCIKMELTPNINGMIGQYVHSNGKIAVLVEIQTETKELVHMSKLQEFSKNIAMQIAATAPLALSSESIDPIDIERERDVYLQKAREEGKPENIIEKIVEGGLKKYFKEVCLLEQTYIRDDKLSIAEFIKNTSKDIGEPLMVTRFVRIQLGTE